MARRRQTTGLPNKSRKDNQPENRSLVNRLLGNPSNRLEREAALNRLLQLGSLGVLGAIAAIIVFVLIYQFAIVPYAFSVATVNGERVGVRDFQNRVRFEHGLVIQQVNNRYAQIQQLIGPNGDPNQFLNQDQQYQQWLRELQLADILGQRVLDDMINDTLIRQAAQERNITVNDDNIQNTINDYFGYDPTQVALIGTPATETPIPEPSATPFVSPTPSSTPLPTQTPTVTPTSEATADVEATAEATPDVTALPTLPPSPTPSQDDIRKNFDDSLDVFRQNIRDTGKVNNATIDAFFEREALRAALLNAVVTTDDKATYVNARHILVETEEEANTIIAALESGESFATLAQTQSTDTGSGQRGGELGWAAAGNYVPEFKAAVLEAPIGAIVGPIKSQFGFHIIQVRAREERDIEGSERNRLRESEFSAWLDNLRTENEDNITINNNWPNFLPTIASS